MPAWNPIPNNVPDIDRLNKPEEGGSYASGGHKYLRYLEVKQEIRPGREILAECQIKTQWRLILVDWIRDVSKRLKLLNETFFLAIGLLGKVQQFQTYFSYDFCTTLFCCIPVILDLILRSFFRQSRLRR